MPVTTFDVKEKYKYLNGFNNYHQSEAIKGVLPISHNSPQKPPAGLYAEKFSGTPFTAPRHENKQTWFYRILPSSCHPAFEKVTTLPHVEDIAPDFGKLETIPNQLRWDPFPHDNDHDFVSGLRLLAGAGDPKLKNGLGYYIYAAGKSMSPQSAFFSADGDLLIVAQEGVLDIRTEFGWLLVRPMEIAVIPRGVKYQVHLPSGPVRGYALELYQGHFQLPELGPIGSNGLANARDFQAPVACFDHDHGATASSDGGGNKYTITVKMNNTFHQTTQSHTPFDVVAWHGTYYPYKYDLGRFNTIGSISFDHPDPSIFTVLTAPTPVPGQAVADFVIFPPRWLVGEDTFRPPWYHRNTMPEKVGTGSCAFMFESCLMIGVTEWGLEKCEKVQREYVEHSWSGLKVHFEMMPEWKGRNGHLLEEGEE
ncbi:homogentisate 1,2-dioxygenase [Coniochaeta sp. 2T2.1]|nr:homogentisate 1,2-dioxygenase [Coniochaeta sp. 2T2.1]